MSDQGRERIRTPSRRVVLQGAAVAAAGVAAGSLAGCGGSGSDTASAPSGSAASSPGPVPTSAPASATAAASSAAASGGAGATLTRSDTVPVGGGVVLADQKVVVTQPTRGTFKGFSAVCTHQGCPVTAVAEGTINCPCHGSKFSAEDGSPINGPATAPLAAIPVRVDGADVVRA